MPKYQHLILSLTILSFNYVEPKKLNLMGHQAPEYASGPKGTMTKIDYINQFRSICDDLQVINNANQAIHQEFKDLFENVEVSNDAKNGSVDCTLSRIFKNDTTMFVPTNKDLQVRVKEVKHCLANVKDTEILQKFISLYESEYMLNAKIRIELFTAYGIKGLLLFKPVNKTYFNSTDPYTHFQYGCNIQASPNNPDNLNYVMNEPIKGINEANFTMIKKETFKDIQFYINNTFDALEDLMNVREMLDKFDPIFQSIQKKFDALAGLHDFKASMEKSNRTNDQQPRLAKIEHFNLLFILLGIITLAVVLMIVLAVLWLKKSKKSGSFSRLEEDPEGGNETNDNTANAVIWSNDQLILFRK